jgi:hypothetical protein
MNLQKTKADRYGWASPGDKGRYELLPLDCLKVDYKYQRNEVSETNTLALASGFLWAAFGTIVVMERGNGDKYIVDGLQRVLAAKKRGDITSVPCRVFQSNGSEHEAKAFLCLNVRRAKVSAVQKFHAADRAGINPEREISEWLQKTHGFRVENDGKNKDVVSWPDSLIQLWKLDKKCCVSAMELHRKIIGDEATHVTVQKGLFWLLHNNVPVQDHIDKLVRSGGRAAILREVKRIEIETQQQTSLRICGLGILSLINHKLRNKIPAPSNS